MTYGQAYGELPSAFYREGYTFNGWYTAKTGGKKVTASTKVATKKNHTLYGQWTKKRSITVTFNPNGGKLPYGEPTMTVTNGSTYGNLQTPSRLGYTFAGWYTAKSGGKKITSDTTVTATANQTLYARWSKGQTFQIKFDPNGGRVAQEHTSVVYSGIYRDMPVPTRNKYHFAGWYTAKSGGRRITPTTKVDITANQTLYARWTQTPVTVTERRGGKWKVMIPANCETAFYANETTADAGSWIREWPWAYSRDCTRMVKLSNGVTRYGYTTSDGDSWWFTYSMEMYID